MIFCLLEVGVEPANASPLPYLSKLVGGEGGWQTRQI